MESKTYIVKGTPVAWSRCAPGYKGQLYDTQKHLKNLYRISLESQHGNKPMFSGPLLLKARFVFGMPASKKCKWNEIRGKPHVFVPDASNLLKFLEDAMVGVLIKDDRNIAQFDVCKIYGDEAYTQFQLVEL